MSVFYTAGYEAGSPLPMTHPRILWDPLAFGASGEAGEGVNLVLRSQAFNDAAWGKVRSSVTPDVEVAPDGTLTADKLIEDTTAADSHVVNNAASIPIVANTTHTLSAYFKASERSRGNLLLVDTGYIDQLRVAFNLGTGTVTPGVVGGGVVSDSGIQALANGWYRVWVTGIIDAVSTAARVQIELVNNTGTNIYTGDGVSGLFVWGAQVEAGPLGGYIFTAGAATPASVTALNMDRMGIPDTSTYASISGYGERSFVVDFGQLRAVDAVGLAGHNLSGVEFFLEGATDTGLTTWAPLFDLTPSDDSTLLMLIEEADLYGLRIRIPDPPLGVATDIAVLYAGVALVMPVRGYGELGPIDLGMDVMINTYRTESGQISGRFIDYTGLRGSLTFLHLKEDWVRVNLIPFLKQAIRIPFFIANRPSGYPDDCAYAWTIQNVIPQRMKMKNYMSVQMEVHAHAPATLF